jgi:hypothetical protein
LQIPSLIKPDWSVNTFCGCRQQKDCNVKRDYFSIVATLLLFKKTTQLNNKPTKRLGTFKKKDSFVAIPK